MSNPLPSTLPQRVKLGALALVVSLIALLPWWRNHDFLRDFYDYGLFINVNARLAQGQRPYSDFTTPAQSAAFLLNYASESLGGGTYVGMSRGAAVLIVVSAVAMTLVLARRFRPAFAALLSLSIVVGSASQHTIVFYNPIGVIAMALTVWSFAAAPLLRRETLGWHVLAAIGLTLGGMNKINFHLLACVMAFGWVVYAWCTRRPSASRVLLTLVFIATFGFLVPIGVEIGWTGASWREWHYNIVELPLSARGGRISKLFTRALYLTTIHNYYGVMRIPQVGLIGVLMPLVAVIAAWRQIVAPGQAWRAVFLVLAALLAMAASSALLLTNNEISHVAFASALVVTIGLWLGFGIEPRGYWFAGGVLLPALLLTGAAWESAWRGDRSQFGHDREPREVYWRGENIDRDFHYLTGLKLPPAMSQSLAGVAQWRRQLSDDDASAIYYGPGSEWLQHVWPVRIVKGLPLVASAFDNPRENAVINREIVAGTTFRQILVVTAWDHWNAAVQAELDRTTLKQRLSNAFTLYQKMPRGILSARPLDFMFSGLGSNVDSMRVITDLQLHSLEGNRRFLGTEEGTGRANVNAPARRIMAEYVLTRVAKESTEPLAASLAIQVRLSPDALLPRWNADVVLPAGTDELVVPVDPIDASGLPTVFSVVIPAGLEHKIRAGWRSFQLLDTVDQEELPPVLRPNVYGLRTADDVRAAVAPQALQNATFFLRNGTTQNGALLLPYASEAWIRLRGMYSEIKITAKSSVPGSNPQLQIYYYKGGRLERFAGTAESSTGNLHYTAWSPENGGWIGILADSHPDSPPVLIQIDSATTP